MWMFGKSFGTKQTQSPIVTPRRHHEGDGNHETADNNVFLLFTFLTLDFHHVTQPHRIPSQRPKEPSGCSKLTPSPWVPQWDRD